MNFVYVAWMLALVPMLATGAGEATPPPASAFAALPEMSFVRLAPNGQRVAWAESFLATSLR